MTTNLTSNLIAASPPLPNPFTPLAFLPPVFAGQAQASAYISVAVLSVSFIIADYSTCTWLNLFLPHASLWDWLIGRDPYVS
jgi:hypothetical protein